MPTERFSLRAKDYARWRPGYPVEIVNAMKLKPGAVVADIGAGTGISSELFLRRGFRVIAVEPNAPMRKQAIGALAGYAGYRCIDGTAEETGLTAASVDALLSMQSFHWFDAERARDEFLRIVKPGGVIAICWNDRQRAGSAFAVGLEDLLSHHSADYNERIRSRTAEAIGNVKRVFAPRPVDEHVYPNSQELDWEGLVGRMRSASYVPLEGQPGHIAFFTGLRELFDRTNSQGTVTIEYECRLYCVRT